MDRNLLLMNLIIHDRSVNSDRIFLMNQNFIFPLHRSQVISTPLTVVIIGGTTRFLSESLPLKLDATLSFDPDVPDQNSNGISYQWSCNSSAALTDSQYGYVPSPGSSRVKHVIALE